MSRRVPAPVFRGVAVGVLVAAVATLGGCSPNEPERPLGTTSTAPSTGPTVTVATAEDLAFEDAEAALRRHVDLLNALGHDPTDKALLKQLRDTSNGQEYNLRNTLYRYAWGPKGIHLSGDGAARVADVERIDAKLDQARPIVRLRACIDSTDVVAVDKAGKRIGPADAPPRSALTFTVMHDPDGVWRVNEGDAAGEGPC
jgi:hypothetical protein